MRDKRVDIPMLGRLAGHTSIVIAAAFGAMVLPPSSATAQPSPVASPVAFKLGDIFAGIGDGKFNHFDSSGVLLATLDDGQTVRTRRRACASTPPARCTPPTSARTA